MANNGLRLYDDPNYGLEPNNMNIGLNMNAGINVNIYVNIAVGINVGVSVNVDVLESETK